MYVRITNGFIIILLQTDSTKKHKIRLPSFCTSAFRSYVEFKDVDICTWTLQTNVHFHSSNHLEVISRHPKFRAATVRVQFWDETPPLNRSQRKLSCNASIRLTFVKFTTGRLKRSFLAVVLPKNSSSFESHA